MGVGTIQHTLHALKWAKDIFKLFTLIDLGDPNWSERSVVVLWQVMGRFFTSVTNRCTPLVIEQNSALGFPGPWKRQGSLGALEKFLREFDFLMDFCIFFKTRNYCQY